MYLYMDVYLWISVCVPGWVAKEGILSSVSLTGIRVSRETPLSTLVWRTHEELCLQKPARPKERTKGQSVRSETPKQSVRSRGSDIQSSGYEAGQSRMKTQQWKEVPDESAFLVAV